MAVSLTEDPKRRWLIAVVEGELSLADTLDFLRTARSGTERRMWPLLFDARGCSTSMRIEDVDAAVALVRAATMAGQRRGHVAIVADDAMLYRWFLLYETRCAAIGARIIRVFRDREDAAEWLEIVSSAREFG